jgi:hypothetical protein
MQVHGVPGVDVALERLHPVAAALKDLDAAAREHRGLELGHRRRRRARSEIRPHEPATLDAGIGQSANLVLERAVGGLDRHVDAAARDIEFPAVIHAPQALGLVAAVEQACAAMRAAVLDQSDGAGRHPKRDEALTEQTHAQRRSFGLGQLARERGGNPILPHEVAHWRSRSDAAEQLVVISAQHGRLRLELCGRADGTHAARGRKRPG